MCPGIFSSNEGAELTEAVARWAKRLAVFRLSLHPVFEFKRGQHYLPSFRGR